MIFNGYVPLNRVAVVFVNGSYPWMNLKYCVLRLRGYYTHYKGVSAVNMCIIRWNEFPAFCNHMSMACIFCNNFFPLNDHFCFSEVFIFTKSVSMKSEFNFYECYSICLKNGW